ncbi:MAG: hypothetical protein RR855_14375, partial [Comamonas sp.]
MQTTQEAIKTIEGGAAPLHSPVRSLSPRQRAWKRFQRNRLGFWSLVLFVALVVISLG